jgi:hypothetical protein
MQQVHDFMGRTTDWLDKTDYIASVVSVARTLQADLSDDMRGLELVEMGIIYMGYNLSIGLWMRMGRSRLCEFGRWSNDSQS